MSWASRLTAMAVLLAFATFAVVTHGATVREALADTDGAAMSLRVEASQQTDCPGGPVAGKVCVGQAQKFDVIVVADAIPASGYIFAQAWIDYDDQGLVSKDNTQALWPDHEPITFLTINDAAHHGAQAGALTGLFPPDPLPASFHKGDLFSFSLTCTQANSTSDIELVPANPHTANTAGSRFTEATGAQIIPEVSGITVNCVPPPPKPVGGIAVDHELRELSLETSQHSGPSIGVLAGIAAALGLGAVVLSGAAWHARRRFSRA